MRSAAPTRRPPGARTAPSRRPRATGATCPAAPAWSSPRSARTITRPTSTPPSARPSLLSEAHTMNRYELLLAVLSVLLAASPAAASGDEMDKLLSDTPASGQAVDVGGVHVDASTASK